MSSFILYLEIVEWWEELIVEKAEKRVDGVSMILKALFVAYSMTGICLLLLALLLYRFQWSEDMVSIGIIVIYIVVTFLTGFFIGKKCGEKKFLWGLLSGIAYFVILVVISLIINHNIGMEVGHTITTFLICSGSGMLGGMLS